MMQRHHAAQKQTFDVFLKTFAQQTSAPFNHCDSCKDKKLCLKSTFVLKNKWINTNFPQKVPFTNQKLDKHEKRSMFITLTCRNIAFMKVIQWYNCNSEVFWCIHNRNIIHRNTVKKFHSTSTHSKYEFKSQEYIWKWYNQWSSHSVSPSIIKIIN